MTATKSTSVKSTKQKAARPKSVVRPAGVNPAAKKAVLAKKVAAKKVVVTKTAKKGVAAKKVVVKKVPARTPTPVRSSAKAVTKKAEGEASARSAKLSEVLPVAVVTPAVDKRPRGERGGRIGRPKTRMELLKAVPTRCPTQIYTYLKGITPFLYSSLTAMFEDMVRRFLNERPWEHGLHWRKPKTAMTYANGMTGKTGWEQVNIQLPQDLAESVGRVAEVCGVSNACLCYTAIFWWVQYIYPPTKMLGTPVSSSSN